MLARGFLVWFGVAVFLIQDTEGYTSNKFRVMQRICEIPMASDIQLVFVEPPAIAIMYT